MQEDVTIVCVLQSWSQSEGQRSWRCRKQLTAKQTPAGRIRWQVYKANALGAGHWVVRASTGWPNVHGWHIPMIKTSTDSLNTCFRCFAPGDWCIDYSNRRVPCSQQDSIFPICIISFGHSTLSRCISRAAGKMFNDIHGYVAWLGKKAIVKKCARSRTVILSLNSWLIHRFLRTREQYKQCPALFL
jgi:hypothetical protein